MDQAERSAWADAIGPLLQIDAASDLLGVSPVALRTMAARHEVLEIVTTDQVPLYPAWQFLEGTVVPGLTALVTTLWPAAEDSWTLASWCRRPQPDLNGQSVADVLTEAASRSTVNASAPEPLPAGVRLVAARAAARWAR